MVSIDDMLVFAQVVESGSFTRAGESLGLGKARVSQIITRLENNLERRLLNRNTRSLSLTTEGARYLESCQAIKQLADQANSPDSAKEPEGNIRITLPVGIHSFLLILAEFQATYPKVNLIIDETDTFTSMIETGTDLAIRATSKLEDSSLYALKLGEVEDVLCVSRAYADKTPEVKTPDDLYRLDWICHYTSQSNRYLNLISESGSVTQLIMKPKIQVNTGSALRLFITQGAGFGTLPKSLIQTDLDQGRLIHLLPDYHQITIPLYLVYQEKKYRSIALKTLIEFIKAKDLAGKKNPN